MHLSKISGSLVRRIVLIFLFLVILPFLLYVAFLWNRDWKIKVDTAFSEMQLVGKFAKGALELWYDDKLADIDALSLMSPEERDQTIFARKDIDLLMQFDSSFDCTYSNLKDIDCKSDFFRAMLEEAEKKASLLSVGKVPNTNVETLFLLHKTGDEIWVVGTDLSKWKRAFTNLQKIGYPVQLSFHSKGKDQKNFLTWTVDQLATWQRGAGLFGALKLRGKNIAIQFSVPNANFTLETSLLADDIANYQGVGVFGHVFLLFIILIGLFGVGAIWMIFRIARPFKQLFFVMEEVKKGNYEKKYVKDPYGFEINDLGVHFNQMLADVLSHQKKAEDERVSKELYLKELEIGHALQNELFPKEIPEFPGIDFGRGFIPAKEVSGDFYDLLLLGDHKLFFSIGDGSDKGISACLYSLMVRSMLRSHAISKEGLEDIILRTNDLFCKDTKESGNFVTAWLGLYQSDTRELQYSSIGHLPGLLILPDGNYQELSTKGIAFGASEKQEIEVQSLNVEEGSLLILYSDGVTEAHNEKGDLFGKSRLIEILQHHRKLSPQALINLLLEEVEKFAGKTAQHDDLTAICLKLR